MAAKKCTACNGEGVEEDYLDSAGYGGTPSFETCRICGGSGEIFDGADTPQPPPQGEDSIVHYLVLADLNARYLFGVEKYGTPLRINNGRDALVDAYQEALDMVMYLRQAIEERKAGAT